MTIRDKSNTLYQAFLNGKRVRKIFLNGVDILYNLVHHPSFTTVDFTASTSTINLDDHPTGQTTTLSWNITGSIQQAEIYEQGNDVPLSASTNSVGTFITGLITTSKTYQLRVTGTDGHVHGIKTVQVFARKRPVITLTVTYNNVPQSPSGNVNTHLAIKIQLQSDDPLTALQISPNLGTYGTGNELLNAWNRHRVGDTFTLQAQVTSSYDTVHTITSTNIAGTSTETIRIKPV